MKASIEVEDRFDLFGAELRMAFEEALVEGGEVLKRAVVSAETRVGQTGKGVWAPDHLRDSFEVTPPTRDGNRSLSVSVVTRDPNWRWQHYGTRGKRRKKLAGGGHASGGGGVKPLYFMTKAMRAAYPVFLEILRRKMPGERAIL